MVTLKTEVNSSSGPAFVEAARRFFHLDRPPSSDQRVDRVAEQPPCLRHDAGELEHAERTPEPSITKRAN
jgi:glutamyl-tRNA reductase